MNEVAIIEILIIFGIIFFQYFVFVKSRTKIKILSNTYPNPEVITVKENFANNGDAEEIIYYNDLEDALISGEPFYYPDNKLHVHRIKEIYEDSYLIGVTEYKNEDENDYTEREYPMYKTALFSLFDSNTIKFISAIRFSDELTNAHLNANEYISTDLLEAEDSSFEFKEIIVDTNEYLLNNKGAAADFNILKDISERYSEALDNEVQAGIATPLYIGLLGTFLGVSMGLGSLLFSGSPEESGSSSSSSFISEDGIRSFLIGVVIAMAGSFFGLFFTLYGNHLLKNGRSQRDKLKNKYYTFLQKSLLPKLNSDMAASLGNLKSVLDSFNHDFLEKVANFQPIISSMTDNIEVQKDFIVKLDQIGFTKMANANIKVFDKIKESERLFDNFLGYQVSLNKTVESGSELADKVYRILSRMTKLEEAFALVPSYLEKHDESIMRQVDFFDRHKKELDSISNKVEQNLDEDAGRLKQLMDQRLDVLERDAQNAYERWQEHFNKLNEDNLYEKIQEFMQPFSKLNEQQDTLNIQQSSIAKTLEINNERLLKKLDKDAHLQQKLAEQFEISNAILAEATKRNRVQVMMDKVFGVPLNGKVNGKV